MNRPKTPINNVEQNNEKQKNDLWNKQIETDVSYFIVKLMGLWLVQLPPFLGGMAAEDSQTSQQTRQTIDAEVQRIVGEQYERAQSLLTEHRMALESLTRQLLQRESLDGSAVKQALEVV
jgi:ATP-dependent Zn protease